MATFKRYPVEGISTPPVVPICSVCRRGMGAGHKMSCPVSKHGAKEQWVDKFTNKVIHDLEGI